MKSDWEALKETMQLMFIELPWDCITWVCKIIYNAIKDGIPQFCFIYLLVLIFGAIPYLIYLMLNTKL